ncbi:MAG TPA: IS481 family transposase [Vicinamibacterales bacterium]|nr:IS481 family transposase [Vicinamibacterales bacterium]
MRLHRNAKTSPKMRQLLIERVSRQGWTQAAAAAAAGISVRTVAKWLQRARHGDAQLEDASSRPHRQPRTLSVERTTAIVALRQQRSTAWEISARLGVPRSTVTRVLQRAGLNRVHRLEPPPVIQRYEWPQAGDLLHLDIKPLSRIRGIGHRIHGDLSVKHRGVGYEYVHVAIDDATRVAFVEVRRSQRRRACAAFLRNALVWFRRRGITVRRVLTDNGAGYKSRRFAGVCRTWQLRHRFTRPYTPRTNGKAERFIQTLLREWAYRRAFLSSTRRTAALASYLRFYNYRRPHASLGRRSPWTRFQEAA